MKDNIASTAFCLLFKLWTLRLTVRQVNGLINHQSPHVRALGFLYLRYVCKPEFLWDWFEKYINDEQEVQVESGLYPRIITIGRLCQQLLKEQKWCDTILPRIPFKLAREIQTKLNEKFDEQRKLEREKLEEEEKKRRDEHRSKHSHHHHHHHHSSRYRSRSRDSRSRSPSRSHHRHHHSSREDEKSKDRINSRDRSRDRDRERSRDKERRSDSRSRSRRSRSRSRS